MAAPDTGEQGPKILDLPITGHVPTPPGQNDPEDVAACVEKLETGFARSASSGPHPTGARPAVRRHAQHADRRQTGADAACSMSGYIEHG
jgi:hypothetical protein